MNILRRSWPNSGRSQTPAVGVYRADRRQLLAAGRWTPERVRRPGRPERQQKPVARDREADERDSGRDANSKTRRRAREARRGQQEPRRGAADARGAARAVDGRPSHHDLYYHARRVPAATVAMIAFAFPALELEGDARSPRISADGLRLRRDRARTPAAYAARRRRRRSARGHVSARCPNTAPTKPYAPAAAPTTG